jgi:hypothetical protein
MNKQNLISRQKLEQKWVSRCNLIRGAAGAAIGTGLLRAHSAYAGDDDDDKGCRGARLKPIPGGGAPFKPFGVPVHHNPNPLSPTTPLADISDPSQITDFDGLVGLTHIQGGGTATNATTSATTTLAFRADMGFARGKFIDIDGQLRRGTFAFV